MNSESTHRGHLIGSIIVTVLSFVILVVYVAYHGQIVPWVDDWDLQFEVIDDFTNGDFPVGLWGFSSSIHRHMIPYLITMLSVPFFGWNMWFDLAINILLLAASLYLLFRLLRSQVKPRTAYIGLSIFAVLIFNLGQRTNIIWGHQQVAILSATCAYSIAALAGKQHWKQSDIWCAALLAIIASWSFLNGLSLWGAVSFMLIIDRQRKKYTFLWIMITIIVAIIWITGIQFINYATDVAVSNSGFSVTTVRKILEFIGSPITYFYHPENLFNVGKTSPFWGSWAVGIALLGVSALAVNTYYQFKTQANSIRVFTPWMILLCYVFGTALMLSLGRSRSFDYLLTSRYVTFATPFWVSLIALMLINWETDSPNALALRRWLMPLNIFTAIIIMFGFVANTISALQAPRIREKLADCVATKLAIDDICTVPFYVGTLNNNVLDRIIILEDKRLSIFRNERILQQRYSLEQIATEQRIFDDEPLSVVTQSSNQTQKFPYYVTIDVLSGRLISSPEINWEDDIEVMLGIQESVVQPSVSMGTFTVSPSAATIPFNLDLREYTGRVITLIITSSSDEISTEDAIWVELINGE